MSGSKYDNLENFFRSRLKDGGLSEQSWNAPPRGVLDHAFNELDQERNRKRRLLFWFAGSGLAIAIIAFVSVLAFNKIEQIDKKVDQLSVLSEAIPQTPLSVSGSQQTAENAMTESKEIRSASISKTTTSSDLKGSDHASHNATIQRQGAVRNIVKPEIVPGHSVEPKMTAVRSSEASQSMNDGELKLAETTNTGIGSGQTTQASVDGAGHALRVKDMRMLDAMTLQPFDIQRSLNIKPGSPQLSPVRRTSNLSAYVVAGHSLSSFRMVQNVNPDFTLTGYDKSYSGYHVGLGLDYGLSERLHLDVALVVSKLGNQSVYEETMAYEKANEMTDINGQLIYRAQIMMESPIGQFASDADFTLDGMSIADEAPMDNITSITQDFTVVGVTAGMSYMLFEQGRLRAYAGAGLGINYFFGLDQCMNTKLYHSGANLMDATYTMSVPSETNATFLSVNGSMRVQYAINERLSLGLNLGYDRALNSVRHAQSGSDVKTYLNSFKSSLAVGYSF